MPQLPPSVGLLEALSSGAEVGLSRAIFFGGGLAAAGYFIEKRLSGLTQSELGTVVSLAEEALAAGNYISALGSTDLIDPKRIPINPYAFGDDWGGKRLRWWGEWNIPGTTEWYQFSGTLPDITDKSAIIAYASALAFSYIEAYPNKFQGPLGGVPTDVNVFIIGTEGAF
jgi:hypothetical protein